MSSLVAASSDPPRVALSFSVRAGLLRSIDWRLTTLGALSFLCHFGVVGAWYSDWMDPVVDDDITASMLPSIVPTAPEPPVESGEAPTERATTSPVAIAQRATSATHSEPRRDGAPRARATPEAVRALLGDVERTRIAILVGLGSGRSLAVATSPESEGAPVDLGALAARTDGIDNASFGLLRLPSGAATTLGARVGLQDLRPATEPAAASTAGQPRAVVPPFDVLYSTPTLSVPMANAEAIIRSQIHSGARHCYQKGLEADPRQSGRLVLEIRVAPSGEVEAAAVTTNTGLSSAVVGCIVRVAQRVRFGPPGPAGSTLGVPFNFVRQAQ